MFLEEPFGLFGHMNPTGHAAVYLSRVCAASPTVLRPCEPGESGVVISRYHRVGGYDWIADEPQQAPLYVSAEMVAALRDDCRVTVRATYATAAAPESGE